MNIFVTGATGFLGRAFCRNAVNSGHEVLALLRSPCRGNSLPEHCRFAPGSLSTLPWRVIEDFSPEVAIHLAWNATPGLYLNSPENSIFVAESKEMFCGLVNLGTRHIIGTGTCMEYAPSAEFLTEDRSPLGPLSPYAQAKIDTCMELQLVAEPAGIVWTWIRPFYPYGVDEHPGRMPSAIARALMSQQAAEIKNPKSIKDYIHVDDIASALLAVVENRLAGAVNVATGQGIQIEEMARMIAIECGFHPDCITCPPVIVKDPFPVTVADITKLRELGWRQRITLQEGIAKLCASLR